MFVEAAPLAAFAFATSITPGPNNLMLMASGARFGLRRTLPHLLGVTTGFGVLAVCAGLGLAEALRRAPMLEGAMQILAAGFILYMAWKIARSGGPTERNADERPLSFLGAVLFQWINPKSWAMALTAVTVYAPENAPLSALAALIAVFCMVNLPCCSIWAAVGGPIASWLGDPRRLRLFNLVMAALLVLSMAPMLA